jgi:hypothetical protein
MTPKGWRAVALALVAGIAVAQGASPQAGLPLLAALAYRGAFVSGPRSTAANHGYLPLAAVGSAPSIPVESYTALVHPTAIGVQFVAASRATLQEADVTMTVTPPGEPSARVHPSIGPNGNISWHPSRGFQPGTWTFLAGSLALGWTERWRVKVPGRWMNPPANGRAAQETLALLNGVRTSLGLSQARLSARLSLASAWHAAYLGRYGTGRPSFHVEQPGPGYRGRYPWNRDLVAGWPDASTGEVGMTAPTVVSGPVVTAALLDTVYHRLALLSDNLTTVGYGTAAGPVTAASIMDLGFGYRSTLPLAVVYPRPGQRGVPRSWLDNETPDPVPRGNGDIFGYPVTADFPTVAQLGPTAALLMAHQRPVPATIDWPGAGDLQGNQLALVPLRPLQAQTRYTVVLVSPAAVFRDGSVRRLQERWSFTTGRGQQSVYLGHWGGKLLVVVDDAASDSVAIGVPVMVQFRVGQRTVTRRTVTGPAGLALVTPPPLQGRWTALASTQSGGFGLIEGGTAR